MDQANLDNIIVALLFASDEPLSLRKISGVLDDCPVEQIQEAIERIRAKFRGDDSVMQLEQVAGGFQFCTNSAYSEYIALLYRGRRKQRLSKAAMETLAIIVYKQPVTRADIENLRGVGCGGVITTLMERTLIRIVGKAKVLGSPFLYGTTQEFLEYLGLNSLRDLPSMEDLEALLEREAAGENGFELGEATREMAENAAPSDLPPDSTVEELETDEDSPLNRATDAGDDLPLNEAVGTDDYSPITDMPDGDVDSSAGGASVPSVREEDFMIAQSPAEPVAQEDSPVDDGGMKGSADDDDTTNDTVELPSGVESDNRTLPEEEFEDTHHVDDHEEK
jgi:segregation and condensation protein B